MIKPIRVLAYKQEPVKFIARRILPSSTRFVLLFDGLTTYGVLANAAELQDGKSIKITYKSGSSLMTNMCLFGNNGASAFHSRIRIDADGSLRVRPTTANTDVITLPAGTIQPNSLYKFELQKSGTNYTLLINGTVAGSGTLSGTAATVNLVGATATAGAGVPGGFAFGQLYDFEINGVLWPIADRNQSIQLPEPNGLGAELITQSVLENPYLKGSQWTYLGNGRWQYVGDGTLNELVFFLNSTQPLAGYLEFEIESISGTLTCSQNNLARSKFTTTGVKRYFYTDRNEGGANGAAVSFKRTDSTVVSCVIKNISFKPLGTCNPLTLFNTTSANWQEVPV